MKLNLNNLKKSVLLLIIVLSVIDFLGLGIYIMSFLCIAEFFLFPAMFFKCIFTIRFLIFALLSITSTALYCILAIGMDTTFIAAHIAMPLNMYICGYILINATYDMDFKQSLIFPSVIVSTFCTVYAFVTSLNKADLSLYSNYSAGYINNLMRTSYSLWDGAPIAGTVLSGVFVPGIALMFYSVICMKRAKKVIGAVCSVLCIWGSMSLGSRANFVIILVAFVLSATILIFSYRQANTGKLLRRVIVVIIAVSVVFELNILDIQEKVLNSTLFYRFSIIDSGIFFSNDSRIDILLPYFIDILNNPLGGIYLEYSTHNNILQFGAMGGVLGLFLALLFFVPLFYRTIICAMGDKTDVRFLTLLFVISILINFMVEAVVVSNAIMYSTFIFFLIMIEQYYLNCQSPNTQK